jgi:hypothetical protein
VTGILTRYRPPAPGAPGFCSRRSDSCKTAVASPTTRERLVAGLRRLCVRRNELDFRIGKILLAGRSRSVVSLDIYNALNTDAIVNLNQNFGAWLRPTEILNPRLAKISVQFDC